MKAISFIVKISLFFLLGFPAVTSAQESLFIPYDATTNSLDLTKVKQRLQHGTTYQVFLSQVNTAHVAQENEIVKSRYVSDIPEVLRSIYAGIPNDAVGLNLPDSRSTSVWKKAQQYYKDLAAIQRISDALYAETQFNPDTVKAESRKKLLLQELQVNSIPEAYKRTQKALDFLDAARRFYTLQLEQTSLDDEQSLKLVEILSSINNYVDNTKTIDFGYLISFIEESQQASDRLSVASFVASGDVVDLNLKFYNTYTKELLLDEVISFDVYNNFSFDFSTGFFYTNLKESAYYLQNSDSGIAYIMEEDQTNADVSIGALGHFTYKFLPQLRAGLALGASISPFDGKLRYLLGPSFIWGKQDQLGLSFGLALAQLDQLSDAVVQEDEGFPLPQGAVGIPTVKKLQSGFFIGITYNLTNRKEP